MSSKQAAIETINAMPDNVTLRDIVEELRILTKLQQAREDVEAGRVISNVDALRVFDRWLTPVNDVRRIICNDG
jgi:hypothetical protein